MVGRGQAVAQALLRRAPTLTLPFESRSRSRLAATLDNGEEVARCSCRAAPSCAMAMPWSPKMAALVRVRAAPQPVLRATSVDPHILLRAAYHLGNRHTPVEVGPDYLQLEHDPVLRDLLLRLGVTRSIAIDAPFEPGSRRLWRRPQA